MRNTSSFANSSEHLKYVEDVLKEELGGLTQARVPGFYDAYFGEITGLEPAAKAVFRKCTEGNNPLYQEEGGWRQWPKAAKECDVINWFAGLADQLLDLAQDHRPTGTRRRLVSQPDKPLQGSIAERKLDTGFVGDPNAGPDSKYHWSQILVPGELKSNPAQDSASNKPKAKPKA